jgi:hypothetical protein
MTQRRLISNRFFWAALVGTLVWLADQPTVTGYQPLLQMFWKPGIWQLPLIDYAALSLSWMAATLFCHLVFFMLQRVRARSHRSQAETRAS